MNIDKIKFKIFIIIILIVGLVTLFVSIKKEPAIKNEILVKEKEKTIIEITEKDREQVLEEQIKNKNFAEQSFIGLEYSKVSLMQLKKEIQEYLELSEETKKERQEGFVKLLQFNKEMFFNRYMKVYLEFPDSDKKMKELDVLAKEAFYKMKEGYIEIEKFIETKDESYLQNAMIYFDEAFIKTNQVLNEIANKDIEIETIWIKLPNNKK